MFVCVYISFPKVVTFPLLSINFISKNRAKFFLTSRKTLLLISFQARASVFLIAKQQLAWISFEKENQNLFQRNFVWWEKKNFPFLAHIFSFATNRISVIKKNWANDKKVAVVEMEIKSRIIQLTCKNEAWGIIWYLLGVMERMWKFYEIKIN